MTAVHLGILLVIIASILEAFGQVFLKMATLRQTSKGLWRVFGLAFFGVQALVYTWSLRYLEVSTAFPLGSLSFVFVTLMSQGILRERVERARWVGIIFILVGSSFVVLRA
jgi:drug/metabolite transporter (DMT)-like permease